METVNRHVGSQKQQVDILLEMVASLPKGATTKNGTVLYEGETVGHFHRLDVATEGLLHEKDGVLYIKTERAVTITHEEHQPVTLEPGVWKVGRVQEYDYLSKLTRSVRD
mgnify:CR=1 FL=1